MRSLTIVFSYDGGDQEFLNEVFAWWHWISKKTNFLTFSIIGDIATLIKRKLSFGSKPENVYGIHISAGSSERCLPSKINTILSGLEILERHEVAMFSESIGVLVGNLNFSFMRPMAEILVHQQVDEKSHRHYVDTKFWQAWIPWTFLTVMKLSQVKLQNVLLLDGFSYYYINSRPCSLPAEENHAPHYILEFIDEFDMQIRYADACGFSSSYAEENARHYANEFEFNFQRLNHRWKRFRLHSYHYRWHHLQTSTKKEEAECSAS